MRQVFVEADQVVDVDVQIVFLQQRIFAKLITKLKVSKPLLPIPNLYSVTLTYR